jgi:hypothetical protein
MFVDRALGLGSFRLSEGNFGSLDDCGKLAYISPVEDAEADPSDHALVAYQF